MKNIREAVHNVIEHRILPWIERDGIGKLILPEQITPADCINLEICKRPSPNHPEHELAIGLTGKAPHCIDGNTFVFTPGRMMLLPGRTPHMETRGKRWRVVTLDLDRPSSILWLTIFPFGARVQVTHIESDKAETEETTQPYMLLDRRFSRQIIDLLEEIRSRPPHYAGVARGILIEFMHRCLRAAVAPATVVDIARVSSRSKPRSKLLGSRPYPYGRAGQSDRAGGRTKAGSKQAQHRVQAAREFIHSNYHRHISMDDIAEAADSSEDYLGRQFKAATGLSTFQYLQNVRIDVAKELLLTGLKVSEVAQLVGIEDAYYFSRLFRRANGMSPIAYRRKAVKTIPPRPPLRNSAK